MATLPVPALPAPPLLYVDGREEDVDAAAKEPAPPVAVVAAVAAEAPRGRAVDAGGWDKVPEPGTGGRSTDIQGCASAALALMRSAGFLASSRFTKSRPGWDKASVRWMRRGR